jgi:hypothetical protein
VRRNVELLDMVASVFCAVRRVLASLCINSVWVGWSYSLLLLLATSQLLLGVL